MHFQGVSSQKNKMREDKERNNPQGFRQRDSTLLPREARDKTVIQGLQRAI